MIILGIETSCDETAVSLIKISGRGKKIEVLSNVVASQISIHRRYGGIVPEVAARAHLVNVFPVIEQAIFSKLSNPQRQIDAIGVTNGPGLITSLLVGVEVAKVLSYVWQIPLVPITHLLAHLYANFLSEKDNQWKKINFPALCLVVSGGHTKLILMKNKERFLELGTTVDDAAGEAFDKVAKLLNLGYPGGPIISRRARQGDSQAIIFPRPMIKQANYNFSFSGLKTAVKYRVAKEKKINQQFVNDICASFQQATVDVLISKAIRATKRFQVNSVLLAGGVAANQQLRQQLSKRVARLSDDIDFFVPPIKLCTDNALMVALATYFKINNKPSLLKYQANWQKIKIDPNLEID